MKRISCFFALFFLVIISISIGNDEQVIVSSRTEIIPKKERDYLEFFFRYAFSTYPLGYVLFGDKPMAYASFTKTECLSDYQKQRNPLLLFAHVNLVHNKFRKGFEVWKKYQHLFPSKNHLLFELKDSRLKDECCIFLINKKAFLAAVQKNLKDFKTILGDDLTPHLLLEKIQSTKDVFKCLKESNLLMGILFGYGRHNAELFQKRYDFIKRYPNKRKECPYNLKLTSLSETSPNPLMMDLPRFAADLNHPETKQLLQKYRSQRREILKRYQSGDFLEVTLQQLCKE